MHLSDFILLYFKDLNQHHINLFVLFNYQKYLLIHINILTNLVQFFYYVIYHFKFHQYLILEIANYIQH